ncbi:MAG: hypothetical protein H6895_01305 [Defluviimonas sp.]|nr:hypothetical protein [Defluviimonas sp.]
MWRFRAVPWRLSWRGQCDRRDDEDQDGDDRDEGKRDLDDPILMSLFALGGTTYGMAEETLAFTRSLSGDDRRGL